MRWAVTRCVFRNYSHNLHLSIIYPTRITSHSATLIYNLFFNKLPAAFSIICSDVSDHLPIIIFWDCLKHVTKPNFKNSNNTYIKISKINNKNLRHNPLNTT